MVGKACGWGLETAVPIVSWGEGEDGKRRQRRGGLREGRRRERHIKECRLPLILALL